MTTTQTEDTLPIKKKRNYFTLFLKIIFYPIFTLILLNVVLYGLLSIPSIQTKVVRYAIERIKPIVKTEVSIDNVQINLFYRIHVKGLYIESQEKDTLLYVKQIDVKLNIWPLFKNKLQIDDITLDHVIGHVSRKTPQSNYNFQFLIDAFASDTKKPPSKKPMTVSISRIRITDSQLFYNILSEARTSTFNPSHIGLTRIDADLGLTSLDLQKLDVSINHLSFKEKSGLEVKNVAMNIHSNDSLIWTNDAQLYLPQSELNVSTAQYNLTTSRFLVRTAQVKITPKDLQAFVPELRNWKDNILLQTTVTGKYPTLNVDSLKLNYSTLLDLAGKAYISDCTHYATSNLSVQLDRFKISPTGIQAFARMGDSTFTSPKIMTTLGDIHIKATMNGKLNHLKLAGDMWANQGLIKINATIKTDSTFHNLNINSELYTQNFNLTPFVNNPDIKHLDARVEITAKQSRTGGFSTDMKGVVDRLEYKQTAINNILVSAYYNPDKMGVTLKGDLPAGKLDAKFDLSNSKIPEYNFDILLAKLKIDRFYTNPNWTNPLLSFHLAGNIKGTKLANIAGHTTLDSLHFSGDNFDFSPGEITFISMIENDRRIIDFNSSLIKFKLTGRYDFLQLGDEFSNVMHQYLPSIFAKQELIKKMSNQFQFEASIQNTTNLSTIFNLPITITNPADVTGMMSFVDNKIDLHANIPSFEYNAIPFKETTLGLSNTAGLLTLEAKTQVEQQIGNIDLTLGMKARNDSLTTRFGFKSIPADSSQTQSTPKIDGRIDAIAHFDRTANKQLHTMLNIEPTAINIGGLTMNFLPATIENNGDQTTIKNCGLGMNKKTYLGIDGTISSNPSDSLTIYFNEAQLGNLLNPFNIEHVKAVADGKIELTNLLDQAQMFTKGFKLKNITIFDDTLGTLNIESRWNKHLNALNLKADLTKGTIDSKIDGLFYLAQDSMDVNLKLDQFSLAWAQPFTSDLLNKLSGSISSNLSIRGLVSKPTVEGWIGANNLDIGVDYTNVTYHVSDTIHVSNKKIGFDNLVVKDNDGNKAFATAEITHNGYKDFNYNLNLKFDNLMILNTMNRTDSLFYGKIFASGTANITGNKNAIDIKVKVKNGKKSTLNILIPQTSTASDYTSIVYINTPQKDTTNRAQKRRKENNSLPLKMNVDLEVTPDINLGVIINPVTGDAMTIKGAGLVNFSYDMLSQTMKAFGDYTLSSGSVKVKVQQLATSFQIKEGSKLHFIGDPTKTTFDIKAYHRTKTDLTTLDPSFASIGLSSTKVTVDCILGIKGSMQKMDLSYDISLPDASDDVQQKVKSLINTNEQKLKQFAYLLAAGSFYSISSSNTSLTSGMWTNIATSALSSGLNAILGSALGDKWQIGTNISSTDGSMSSMDMSVSVSTKLLNDKLMLNTNLGYRTDQSNANENSFIGDFDAEYKLSHGIKLKAYNKTNDNIYDQAPTTQGVGIIFTKEAKTLKELFHFF